MTSVLGLITARGGSKGLRRKNVRDLCGMPLIGWTITAALKSGSLDRVVVSTDDAEIAAVSRRCGAEVPFVRPSELAEDLSSHIGVVLHALDWLASNESYFPRYVALLQPTVPFRSTEDIDACVATANQWNADSVISVMKCKTHPRLLKTVDDTGVMSDYVESIDGDLPRQTLPEVYALNGAVYLVRPDLLRLRRSWYSEKTFAHVMPSERSIDIDSEWDLLLAEMIASRLQLSPN